MKKFLLFILLVISFGGAGAQIRGVEALKHLRITDFLFNSATIGWFVTANGVIHRTGDGAKSVLKLTEATPEFIGLHIYFASDGTGFLYGDQGVIYRTENGGWDWELIPTPTNRMIEAMHFTDALHGWAAGGYDTEERLLLRTTNGGRSWYAKQLPCWTHIYDVHFFDESTGLISADSSLVLKTTDAGKTWETKVDQYSNDHSWSGTKFQDIFLDGTDIFTVGYDWNPGYVMGSTVLLHSSDSGETWSSTPIDDLPMQHPHNVVQITSGRSIIWQDKEIYTTEDDWQSSDHYTAPYDISVLKYHHKAGLLSIAGKILYGIDALTSVPDGTDAAPTGFSLEQNYPNPFNPATSITFSLPEAGDVQLAVYDLLGRQIEQLFSGWKPAGRHIVQYAPTDAATSVMVYRITVTTDSEMYTDAKKCLFIK